jgi:hypothetical protein
MLNVNDLRKRNFEIATVLALAIGNCAVTVRQRGQLVLETELDEPMILDVWTRGFVA